MLYANKFAFWKSNSWIWFDIKFHVKTKLNFFHVAIFRFVFITSTIFTTIRFHHYNFLLRKLKHLTCFQIFKHCKTFRVQINRKCESNFDIIIWSHAEQTSNQKKVCLHFFVSQQTVNRVTCNWNTLLDLFVSLNMQNDYIIEDLQSN